jgi:heptosyltransferase-2
MTEFSNAAGYAWPKEKPKNIIVRMPNWLGDLVMATPVLADLRSHYPDATITAMCQSNVCPLITHDPNIDEIFCYKRPSGWIHRRQHFEITEPLKKGEYDLGVLLTNSFSSAWWFWRGNVKNRLGFATHLRTLLLNKAVPFPKEIETQHLVITYKMLLKPLDIGISKTPTKLYLTDQEIQEAKDLLKKFGIDFGKHKIIGINPGAAYGTAKCWLPERFIDVTKRLVENPENYVVYFGDNVGAPVVNQICQHFPNRVINLAGKTSIRQLMALVKCCSAFLTNDSGPMHIAAALGTPLLALFGSTNEVKTGPYPKGRIIHKHVECSPCYKRVCPIDFRCMKRIEVDEVYNELISVLEESGQDPSP